MILDPCAAVHRNVACVELSLSRQLLICLLLKREEAEITRSKFVLRGTSRSLAVLRGPEGETHC